MFRRNIFYLVILLFATNSYGKTSIDSLKNQLKFQNGESYLNTIMKITREYNKGTKIDSIVHYAYLSFNKARELKDNKAILQSSLYLASGLYTSDKTVESRDVLDIALKYATKLGDNTAIAQHHYLLANNYQQEADYSNAFKWFILTYEFTLDLIKSGNKDKRIRWYCKLGSRQLAYTYVYASQHQEGIEYYLDKIANIDNSIPDEIKRCYYSDISYIYSQGIDHKKGAEYSKKALNISLKLNDKEDIFQDCAYVGIALGYYDIKESNKYYFKCLDYVSATDKKRAWVYNDIARNYNYMGKLKESIEYQFKCIDVHESNKDSLGLTFGYISLGINLLNWHNYHESEKYLLKATDYFKRKKLFLKLSETTSELTELYIRTHDFEKAKECVELMKELDTKVKVHRSSGLYHSKYAYYLLKAEKKFDNALENFYIALKFFENAKDPKNKIFCLSHIAETYFKKNMFNLAKQYYHQALNQINRNNQIQIEKEATKSLINIYEIENKKDSAYIYLKKLSKIDKIIFERKAILSVFKKQRDYELLHEKNKLKKLESSNSQLWKNIKSYKYLYFIIIFISILSTITVIYIRNRKHKKIIIKKEEERNKINQSFENTKITIEKFSEELSEKEEAFNKLKKSVKDEPKETIQPISHESICKNLLNSELVTEEQWGDFFNSFNKIYPDFINRLKINYPKLSKNDIKIFILMKLGLSAKEISKALMISTSSLMTSRYRIRKKLNLKPEDKLEEIIK